MPVFALDLKPVPSGRAPELGDRLTGRATKQGVVYGDPGIIYLLDQDNPFLTSALRTCQYRLSQEVKSAWSLEWEERQSFPAPGCPIKFEPEGAVREETHVSSGGYFSCPVLRDPSRGPRFLESTVIKKIF